MKVQEAKEIAQAQNPDCEVKIIPAKHELKEPTTAEFLKRKQHYTDQLMKFKDRLDDWQKRNPNRPAPLHIDQAGIVHWVNRKLRREFGR